MDTKIINLDYNLEENFYKKLKENYLNNFVIAIPTETVYGLSADATNYKAIEKIFISKGRPSDNPLIVHFYDISQINYIVDIENENVKKLASEFWPGPLTLILPIKDRDVIAKNVTSELNTLAVRMPSNYYARNILKNTGILLAAPSANLSGKPSPTKSEHVINDLNGKIDMILCGDNSEIGVESTVIDCTQNPFVILRPGSITKEDIEKVIGQDNIVYNNQNLDEIPISPGMKYRHYSPEGELIIYEEDLDSLIEILKNKNSDIGFITYKKYKDKLTELNINIKYLAENEEDIIESNKNLYNILREFDLDNTKKIYILKILENSNNKALLNRINKASSKK